MAFELELGGDAGNEWVVRLDISLLLFHRTAPMKCAIELFIAPA